MSFAAKVARKSVEGASDLLNISPETLHQQLIDALHHIRLLLLVKPEAEMDFPRLALRDFVC